MEWRGGNVFRSVHFARFVAHAAGLAVAKCGGLFFFFDLNVGGGGTGRKLCSRDPRTRRKAPSGDAPGFTAAHSAFAAGPGGHNSDAAQRREEEHMLIRFPSQSACSGKTAAIRKINAKCKCKMLILTKNSGLDAGSERCYAWARRKCRDSNHEPVI